MMKNRAIKLFVLLENEISTSFILFRRFEIRILVEKIVVS
jgi:hypothetical protein